MAERRKGRARQHEQMAAVDEATICPHIEPLATGGYDE
jgi:hypothetical protein